MPTLPNTPRRHATVDQYQARTRDLIRNPRVLAVVVIALALVLTLAAVVGDRAWRAGALVAALAVLVVPLAVVGVRVSRLRQTREWDARAIRRRAWIVLPITAVILATVVAGIAVKPALLGILAAVVGLYAVIVGGWYALYGLAHLGRVCARHAAAAMFMLRTFLKRHPTCSESASDDPGRTVKTDPHTAGTETHPFGRTDEDLRPSGPMTTYPATSTNP